MVLLRGMAGQGRSAIRGQERSVHALHLSETVPGTRVPGRRDGRFTACRLRRRTAQMRVQAVESQTTEGGT